LPLFDCAFGLRWQSASGDTAFATDATPKSGVALRFPPQSKTLHPTVSGPKRKMRLATVLRSPDNRQPKTSNRCADRALETPEQVRTVLLKNK
jgi:hypothetical protein